jgi:hypothetical protein
MRGNGTNCIRIVPYSAVQFGSYNFYKKVRDRFDHGFLGNLGQKSLVHLLIASSSSNLRLELISIHSDALFVVELLALPLSSSHTL